MEQHQALAAVVSDALAPPDEKSESPDWRAYRLAQLLKEALSERMQMYQLIDCLTASHEAFVKEGGAA